MREGTPKSRDAVTPETDSTFELLENQLNRYQAIISRLAGNSVQVKTWAFTATAALAALAIDQDEVALWVVSLVLLAAFFYLDAYYLALEQHFRATSNSLAEDGSRRESIELSRLLVIERSAATWRRVITCGARSHTAVIYLVVTGGLVAGLIATAS